MESSLEVGNLVKIVMPKSIESEHNIYMSQNIVDIAFDVSLFQSLASIYVLSWILKSLLLPYLCHVLCRSPYVFVEDLVELFWVNHECTFTV